MALVPFYNGNWWSEWDDMYYEDNREGEDGEEMTQDAPSSPEYPLNPEEDDYMALHHTFTAPC